MLEILGITSPIFILIVLGFVSARLGLVNAEQARGMGTFVIFFALPSLVFKAISERQLSEVLHWPFLSAYALAAVSVFTVGFVLARKIRQQNTTSSAILAMGMSISNSGFVGYPIAYMVLGPTAALGVALVMLVENLVVLPLALALAEAGQQSGRARDVLRETVLRLVKNPLIIAISLGLLASIINLQLPTVPAKVLNMLVGASAPVALFVIGATLSTLKANGLFADIAQTSLGKSIVHPLFLFLAFFIFDDIEPMLMVAGLLYAAAPMMTIYPILGQRYDLEARCAAALVVNMVFAFFTINALLWLLRWQGMLPA